MRKQLFGRTFRAVLGQMLWWLRGRETGGRSPVESLRW